MIISSPAFASNQPIPPEYAYSDEQKHPVNPPLTFYNIPPGTKSLSLVMDDPDAKGGTFVHWLLWNLSPKKLSIQKGECMRLKHCGLNGYNKTGYAGPNPPLQEEHRYFFRLYALNVKLDLKIGSIHEDLNLAMGGHILEQTNIFGVFKKPVTNYEAKKYAPKIFK
ncbi:MAG: YbhB/YbcL family Raf kinase inhibitor-like protein [Candidatus Doudnabacteria bacterium]|nr:YbhB/YbcL family Raf kinase inhibitor-like protein [Candidatus Doudnabacteria bacterium]